MRRAILAGAGFGLVVAVVELSLGARRLIEFHMAPPIPLMLQATAWMVALGALVGGGLAFLRRLPAGAGLHLLGVFGLWTAIELWATPASTTLRGMALVGPGAALVTLALSRRVFRDRTAIAVLLGILLVSGAVAVPEIAARRATRETPLETESLSVAPPGAPDVVLVVLDTVRADHVSAYGYPRETTPTFDGLAREGALFLDACAPANWSLPAHASLFTGLYPSSHGAHLEHRFLDDSAPTLAEVLRRHGYDTRSFTANAWISGALGLTRGFAWTDEAWREGDVGRDFQFVFRLLGRLGFGPTDKGGAKVVEHLEGWLAERPEDARPAFVFLNFIEAHFPYHQVPPEYLKRFSDRPRGELRDLSQALLAEQFGDAEVDVDRAREPATEMYDAGVRYADHLLHRVVEAFRARGTLDRTIWIVLSDHGELLGERDSFGHGRSLLQAELHVPLLLRYPPRIPAGVHVDTPVSTVGVYATVLDLLGIPLPAPVQAGSLAATLDGGPQAGAILAERFRVLNNGLLGTRHEDPLLRNDRRYRAFRDGRWKLIETSAGERFLFDLGHDLRELDDQAERPRSPVERVAGRLRAWQAAMALPELSSETARATPPELDPTARERLRALGYVE